MLTADGFDRARRLRLFAVLAAGLGVQAATGLHVSSVSAQSSSSPSTSSPSTSSPSPSSPGTPAPGTTAPGAPPGDASPPGSAAPPSAVKPPEPSSAAEAAEPTPEHVAKARQLILATGISRSFQIIIPEFMAQIGNTLTQSRPELIDDMNKVLDQLRPEFDRQSDEMIDQSARIYAKLLSEKDIDAVLAFFNSEAGRRYVGAQPLFLNQLVSGMQAWQQKISTTMLARVREEMKKKGHDL